MMMKTKIDGYLHKQQTTEEKLAMIQKQREQELRAKHNIDVIKRNDRIENVKRIQKMQEYQKEQLLQRIQADTMKAQLIK